MPAPSKIVGNPMETSQSRPTEKIQSEKIRAAGRGASRPVCRQSKLIKGGENRRNSVVARFVTTGGHISGQNPLRVGAGTGIDGQLKRILPTNTVSKNVS
jgi:hypothetical protein